MRDLRLLLVDDEADFRHTIAKRLDRRGISPEQAASGEECLEVLEKGPVDVVVLDVKMPGMSGIEVLHHIKEHHPKTEVILLTGHATTQDGVEGIKAGAFDYLSKPIELEHLLGKIHQAYDKLRREEEKQREIEFRTKMEQQMIACERLASLGTLAAGVAHEINNPLAIIKESAGWLDLLLKKEELSGMPRKKDFELALAKIEKAIDRARRITHQLLGLARKDDSVFAEVNLKDLIQEAAQLISREAANKDLEIVQDIDEASSTIWCDPYPLRQVLINLLTNAIHATGAGGKITVTLKGGKEKVTLGIHDTGEGIPKENLDRIFEPFFSTKSPGQGTGLGLFVSRGIIEKMGGAIQVESQLGKGSRFTVDLPRHCEIKEEVIQDGRMDFLDKISKSP